jgi:hypothetical protein
VQVLKASAGADRRDRARHLKDQVAGVHHQHDRPLVRETNDEWAIARRCMSLQTVARASATPAVRPPAVAA